MLIDILTNLLSGAANLFQVWNFTLLVTGTLIGVIAGALPGIAFVNAMALALPFAYFMSPVSAMLFLTGIYVGGIFGGSISSILLNIPGSPGSLPATWDGYPMTQKGKSAKALGIAITCSAIGGMFSALLMIFFAPPFADFALTFDQPEFFAATFLGLVTVVAIAKGNMLPALVSLFAGLICGSIGFDFFYGAPRLTYGLDALDGGVHFVVALIGMFAVGEVLYTLTQNLTTNHRNLESHTKLPSTRELWKLKGTIARASGIGCMIGVIPGAGGIVGAVISYGVEKQVSKRGDEFGTGIEEGLAAPETAKNATTGAATIPMLTLGIPGSAATAIMMAALMLKGVNPGPILFIQGKELVYTIFAGYLVANVLIVVFGLIIARGFSYIMRVPPSILYAMIIVLSVIGAFAVRNNIFDIYIALGFGVLSYFMKRFNIPTTPLVLGLILGPLMERFYLTSLASYETPAEFLLRPKTAVIMSIALLFMFWSLWPSIKELILDVNKKLNNRSRPKT
jgi:putative tricarboxylic transport membrane protein